MNTKEVVKKDGIVTENLMGGMFRVELEDKTMAICTISQLLRKNSIKVYLGDRVQVEFSPYDLTRGRICYRYNK
jgi:translation initiation factor IF-1